MIYIPRIRYVSNSNLETANIVETIAKDNEKINKVIELCKELGLEYQIVEDIEKPITKVLINISYKKELLWSKN